jgi:hypothetical protein
MTDSSYLSHASKKISSDQAKERAPNPKRHFTSPEMLLADAGLSNDEKLALLTEWDLEIDNRLKAEEEGMSVSDPMHNRVEAKLADEAARVKSALTEVSEKIAEGSAQSG